MILMSPALRGRTACLLAALVAVTAFCDARAEWLDPVQSFIAAHGARPKGRLLQGSDGNFYGVTAAGGASGAGIVFRASRDGTLTTLHDFSLAEAPVLGGLVEGADGAFYGLVGHGLGMLYRVTADGAFTPVATFDGANGAGPAGVLTRGSDGALYGLGLGNYNWPASVFKLDGSGTLATVATFSGITDTNAHCSNVLEGGDGTFYAAIGRSVFRVTPAGAVSTIATLEGDCVGELTLGGDGNIYGTTATGGDPAGSTLFSLSLAGTMTRVASLGFSVSSGAVEGVDGAFYGTTTTCCSSYAYRVASDGSVATLATFDTAMGTVSALRLGTDGNFYGSSIDFDQGYLGYLYELKPDGTVSTLSTFVYENGAEAVALMRGADGLLYGVTARGGSRDGGTLFKLGGDGTLQVVASFPWPGEGPIQRCLIQGTDGAFYGVTASRPPLEQSRIFRVALDGSVVAIVTVPSSVSSSLGCPLEATDGNFYGAAGVFGSPGFIYQATPDGSFSQWFKFSSNGIGPTGPLVQGVDGSLFGTASGGYGSVFKVSPNRTLTTLRSYSGSDGAYPHDLAIDSQGRILGLTENFSDGTYFHGATLFRIDDPGVPTVVTFAGRGFPDGPPVFGPDGAAYVLTNDFLNLIQVSVLRVDNDGTVTRIAEADWTSHVRALTFGQDGLMYAVSDGAGANKRGAVVRIPRSRAAPQFDTGGGAGAFELWSSGFLLLLAVFRRRGSLV